MTPGYAAVHLEAVASTQDEARARFAKTPILVTARRQDAGRGRFGRVWESAPRAVAASIAFRPSWESAAWGRISLVGGLAAANLIETAGGPPISLKWPNDLIDRHGRKLGGLLGEIEGGSVVIGLGINLFWPDPPAGIGAVLELDPGVEVPIRMAEQWADNLFERLAVPPAAWGREEYTGRCSLLGEEVRWEPDQTGIAIDIGPDGELVVDQGGSRRSLLSGEVRTLRIVEGT